jgi:hypothetical protein
MTEFDRTVEDIGNIHSLEHVNVRVPDQHAATLFYVSGLGMTRDPFLVTGVENMWINVGQAQFHLPTGEPQVVRGHVGLVLPDLQALVSRLAKVRAPLEGSQFSFSEQQDHVAVTCPWGNKIRCFAPAKRFGPMTLGIAYVSFDVPQGTAAGITRFYQDLIKTPAKVIEGDAEPVARVCAGPSQYMDFCETSAPAADYDGHHVAIYIADFSGPYQRLRDTGFISQEDNQHQYRFDVIPDLETGQELFRIQHEVRSLRHPLFGRPQLNRNPAQTNAEYTPGHDTTTWA